MRKRGVIVGVTLAIALALAVGVAAGLFNRHYARFDERVWKKPVSYCVNSPRATMLHDVISNRVKKGMSMASGRALLGRPDGQYPEEWLYYVTREKSWTHEGCVSLSVRTDGREVTGVTSSHHSG